MPRVNRADLARHMGVNKSQITRWIKSGRLSPPDCHGLLDLDQALRERAVTESTEARHQARKAQWDEAKARAAQAAQAAAQTATAPPEAPEPPAATETLGLLHRRAALKRLEAQAEQANLELDKSAGLLVELAEVDFVLADFGRAVADRLGAVPYRCTAELVACQGDAGRISKTLEDAMHQAIAELNDHLKRQMESTL